ncbi:MAG: hypothetical protein ACI32N_02730 [Bulleidia sp.]
MRIPLFQFVDDTITLFESKQAAYEYVEGRVKGLFSSFFSEKDDHVVLIRSRIKQADSLREKLIRNRFYLDWPEPVETLAHLTDIVGVTIECRFIRNEAQLFRKLFRFFRPYKENDYVCVTDDNCYLNLRMSQPQIQRNGFTIYRMDGYYMFNNERVNFELQIKSLVHNFWSEIEHEVVYKNPDFIQYDTFNKDMLGAIRDNLDVVDRQLEIMYNEISLQTKNAQIGMDEAGFKVFVTSSINELVNRKMKESLGFACDFRNCAASIAQYIYVRDFVGGNHNQIRMLEYLELLNDLTTTPIDFSVQISLDRHYSHENRFCDIAGRYMESKLNVDFQWHVFFIMIFLLRSGSNIEDLDDYIQVFYRLVIQPSWLKHPFTGFSEQDAFDIRSTLEAIMAETMISYDTIRMVYEEQMYGMMNAFEAVVSDVEKNITTMDQFDQNRDKIERTLGMKLHEVFAK